MNELLWNPVKCLVMPTSPSVRYSNKVNWNRSSAGNLAMVGQLIRDEFYVALRNDLVDERQVGVGRTRLSQTLPS